MYKFNNLPKSTQRKILEETDYELSFLRINQKSSLQASQKILDKSTNISTSGSTFGSVSEVLNAKVEAIMNKPAIRTQYVYILNDEPKNNTWRTRSNKINIDGMLILPNKDQYVLVNKDALYEEKLKADNISFIKKESIIVSVIQPVPGGLNQLFGKITEPIDVLFCNELGDTCFILQNPLHNQAVIQQIKNII